MIIIGLFVYQPLWGYFSVCSYKIYVLLIDPYRVIYVFLLDTPLDAGES